MHHNYKSALSVSIALALFAFSKPASADVITDWNLITVKATKVAKYNSNLGSRIEAIEAIAVYDAVNSIKKIGTPYHYYAPPSGPTSAQAAAAQAAHDVLVNYFPAQKPSLDSALTSSLSLVNDGPADKGQAIGAASAADIIALRANDGSDPNVGYPGPAKPGVGQYRPTPAGFVPGINQQWGTVKPFLLKSNTQFRPAAPPPLGSDEFKKALALVDELGSSKSTKRTEDQTHIAQFYKQDAELTVNEAARALAIAHKTPIEVNALAFVLADIAEADARIGLWDAKYNYLLWRPVTALNADADGGVTNNYAKWTPLLSTPPHPSYPCGHCGTVTAGFEVLKKFYGDDNTIELHTTTPGEPARTIKSLSDGELENGWSRVYGGIHYSFENDAAQKLGRQVADYVLKNGPKSK
ncbi:MAG TPA: vanadium-dependent haloperoxidase [Mucilaginibacter sp.]|nr:vanadium-dependent haloperoxidase [Mucilaginibacter sp.]